MTGRTSQKTLASLGKMTGGMLRLCVVLAILSVVLACDSEHDITYVNLTDENVTVTGDGVVLAKVAPHGSVTKSRIPFQRPRLIEAKNSVGDIVYSETLSWDEIGERDWTITINAQDSQ